MKEASGEANMTVITIVLIALVLAVGKPIIEGLLKGTEDSTTCLNKGMCWENGQCVQCK